VKRRLYARNGVPEVWFVHLADEAVEVLRHGDGAYLPAGYFRRGAVLTSRALPGLTLPVDELFEEWA
jgi:Uma2 family endonuclease